MLCADIDEDTEMETAALVAAADGRALAEACDVSEAAAARRTLAKAERELGGLDILVNNAAFFATRAPLGELDAMRWARTMYGVVPGGSSMSAPGIGEIRGLNTGRATMKFGIHSGLWMARWTDDIAPIFATVADHRL